jgi:hypothetical protein
VVEGKDMPNSILVRSIICFMVFMVTACATTKGTPASLFEPPPLGTHIHPDDIGPPAPRKLSQEELEEQSKHPDDPNGCYRFHHLAHWTCTHPAISSAIIMLGIVAILKIAADHSNKHNLDHAAPPKQCGWVPNKDIFGQTVQGDPVVWQCN